MSGRGAMLGMVLLAVVGVGACRSAGADPAPARPGVSPEASRDSAPGPGRTDAAATEILLAQGRETGYVIQVDPLASPAEQAAAVTLADHLFRITQADFRLVHALPTSGKMVIAVGPGAAKALAPTLDLGLATLGQDGVVLHSVGEGLVLSGAEGSRRGTVYAVGLFLERLGCRWWTETAASIPRRPTLRIPRQAVRYRPALEYREVLQPEDSLFAVMNRLNGTNYRIPQQAGGTVAYLGPYFVHTFSQIVSPKEQFAEHPQWFAEIAGRRQTGSWDGRSPGHADGCQLCLSNPDLLQYVIGKVKGYLVGQPPDAIVSVSQSDGNGACQCTACRAIEAAEGGPSGPILRFVNAVAAAVEPEHPQAVIDTLLYSYSVKPPLLTRPRRNVQVRSCAFNARYLAPYDAPANRVYAGDLRALAAMRPTHFGVWDYGTDFGNYIFPFPNLHVTSHNIRWFVANGVTGYMLQGVHQGVGGDMQALKHWVFARLLWDPTLDEMALAREFAAGYYAQAAPRICDQLALLSSGDPLRRGFLRPDALARAYALFLAGRDLVASDPLVRCRVELFFAPTLNAILMNWSLLQQQFAGQPWPFPATPGELADEFVRICTENRVGRASENGPSPAQWAARLRVARTPGTPVAEFAQLDPADRLEVQEHLFEKVAGPDRVQILADAKASDGSAAVMPATGSGWWVQYWLPEMAAKPGTSGRWQVYAAIRVVRKGPTGGSFSAGIYDLVAGKVVTQLAPPDPQDDDYHLYPLGPVLPGGNYVWIAPVDNPDNVASVSVDRFLLIREAGQPAALSPEAAP